MTFCLFPDCCQEESASSVFWYFCLVFRLLLVFAACSCYDLMCTVEVIDLNFLPDLSSNPSGSFPSRSGWFNSCQDPAMNPQLLSFLLLEINSAPQAGLTMTATAC